MVYVKKGGHKPSSSMGKIVKSLMYQNILNITT